MLKGISNRLPCSRFVNRCITWSAFIACTWIGCWSVSAQTTTEEQQSDLKVVTASHTEPVTMFSQPATAPWEVVGNQPGYLKVEVGRVLIHPYAKMYQPMIAAALNSALRSTTKETPNLKQFDLSLEEITQLQSGLTVSYSYNPDEPDGQRFSLSFGLNTSAEITAANPVDWRGFINALDFEKYHAYIAAASPELAEADLEVVREAWLKSAKKSHVHIFDMKSLQASKVALESPTETQKAVWKSVSGGAVAVVYNIDHAGEVPEEYKELDGRNQANLEMTIATETVAWGVDFSQDYKTFQVRFAAVPKEGVSTGELLDKFEAFKVAFADHSEEFAQQLLESLKEAKVTMVESQLSNGKTTKAYMLVEGKCTIDFFKLMKSNQED